MTRWYNGINMVYNKEQVCSIILFGIKYRYYYGDGKCDMFEKEKAGELIKRIAENMLLMRNAKEVVYRPYKKNKAVTRKILGEIYVDLRALYPNAKDGDFVYVSTMALVPYPEMVTICCHGAEELTLDGQKVFLDDNGRADISVNNGSLLRFKCIARKDKFGVGYVLSTVFYPGMWACDYLYWIRCTIPIEEYSVEDGVAISALNSDVYVFPKATEARNTIDFSHIYTKGRYAFALTYAMEDTVYNGDKEAFVNGRRYDGGIIKKGAAVMIRIKKGEDWILTMGDDSGFGIPFMETKRNHGGKWLIIGGFDSGELPEIQFKHPYGGEFWRLADGSYLRPYLDTSFYGQWFYALMVGQYGILKASKLMGEKLKQYFINGMNILVDYFAYARYDAQIFGSPTFLQRSVRLEDLDSIGTIGMNLCDLYSITQNEQIKKVIAALYKAMEYIPKFPDGTFHRENTMWADDTFMSLPFLARLAEISGDERIFDECVLQLRGFYKRLYMEDKNLFSHIFFLDDGQANRVPWGRGNGWVFLTLSEVLKKLPDAYQDKAWIKELFCRFAEGIKNVQSDSGLWHQVLDIPSTYEETSCTGMFALGMLRGVENGWLGEEYRETIDKALNGLEKKAIDAKGNVIGVCRGSECSYDPEYYANLSTVVNDDHGTGIILALLSEYLESSVIN